MSKSLFIEVYFIVIGLCAVLLPAIACTLTIIPHSLINLPNKKYWLSPERADETVGFIKRQMLWFSCATMALLIDVFHQGFQVNIGRERSLSHPIQSLALYLLYAAVWSVWFILKFRKVG